MLKKLEFFTVPYEQFLVYLPGTSGNRRCPPPPPGYPPAPPSCPPVHGINVIVANCKYFYTA
jgi:hypothetical protein